MKEKEKEENNEQTETPIDTASARSDEYCDACECDPCDCNWGNDQ